VIESISLKFLELEFEAAFGYKFNAYNCAHETLTLMLSLIDEVLQKEDITTMLDTLAGGCIFIVSVAKTR